MLSSTYLHICIVENENWIYTICCIQICRCLFMYIKIVSNAYICYVTYKMPNNLLRLNSKHKLLTTFLNTHIYRIYIYMKIIVVHLIVCFPRIWSQFQYFIHRGIVIKQYNLLENNFLVVAKIYLYDCCLSYNFSDLSSCVRSQNMITIKFSFCIILHRPWAIIIISFLFFRRIAFSLKISYREKVYSYFNERNVKIQDKSCYSQEFIY